MQRDSVDVYFLKMAFLVASRGTCSRRRVGAVLVDRHRHVLATGYNGVPAGLPHCGDDPCLGAGAASGTQLDACLATHAEQNALLQCSNSMAIDTLYTTLSPCITCIKLMLNTSCRRIVFGEHYCHWQSFDLWHQAGRRVEYVSLPASVTLALRGN